MYNPRLEKEVSTIRELMCKLGCLNEVRIPLNESQASKSISAAKALAMKELKCNEEGANDFIKRLRNDMPALNGNNGAAKFMLGVARMSCDDQLKDARTKQQLNDTLEYVASPAHINEYDRNLNKLSAQELIQRFANALDADFEKDKAEVSQQQYTANGQYDIVRIDSFEQAQEYGNYTEWCVTHYVENFNGYTNDGINQFYFCLRKGFESVEKKVGEGCPLDEYGLSMVAVCVNERGALQYCTCRWNHKNGGNDKIMNTKQVSELIGQNFYDVFKPNRNWQEAVENALARLKNGESPIVVFDECTKVYNGYRMVRLMKKWNYLTADNNFLSPNQWFDDCGIFENGYAIVRRNKKYNFIGTDGNIVSPNQWFDDCYNFVNGYAQVVRTDKDYNSKYNFIDTNGNLLSPNEWFNVCYAFENGYAQVQVKDKDNHYKYNWIGTDGNLVSPNEWFDECYNFINGYATVMLKDKDNNDKFNWIDTDGNLLSPNLWFDDCDPFQDGRAQVKLNGKWNFIDTDGNLYDFYNQPIGNVREFGQQATNESIDRIIKESINQVLRSCRRLYY